MRDRPLEQQQAADQAHAKFDDEKSEFLGTLKLWSWLEQLARRARRASALDRASTSSCCATTSSRRAGCANGATSTRSCRRSSPSTAGASTRTPATYEQLHLSMLAGLLGNIGVKSDEDESYLGARGIRF